MREITLHWGKFMLTLHLLKQQFIIHTTEIRLEYFFFLSGFFALLRMRTLKARFLLLLALLYNQQKAALVAQNCFLKLFVITYSSLCISDIYGDTHSVL